ncbi:MAG: VOC family protein [Roseiflexus sp.]|nr:VOC family protein [Roseiflexus sp.]MBO9336198.1 VOC family protein [Roseiflexus sp.]MBO9342528.1 VOC family protein [Roseiflexus sp.]MBO9365026.1 VOC family protein [Roseiflexus sp.]MBO9382893.1 VOC family protein [Roseiflexus sp.]
MIHAIDHMVILVHDLAAATNDYASLGFTVTPGGVHADGATHNALVALADGSYLELIAFRREAPDHIWWRYVAEGEGLIDFALLPGAIDDDIAAARMLGLDIAGPFSGGRERPDGVRIAWKTARLATPDLPFLCSDVTPRDLRVPTGAARLHRNGATGIARVLVATRDPAVSAARYRALLGIEGTTVAEGVSFQLGASAIVLIALNERHRREGPCALELCGGASVDLDPAITHGVPIRLGA